jgi:hypothetical protein
VAVVGLEVIQLLRLNKLEMLEVQVAVDDTVVLEEQAQLHKVVLVAQAPVVVKEVAEAAAEFLE